MSELLRLLNSLGGASDFFLGAGIAWVLFEVRLMKARAKEDRQRNEADHARLFKVVGEVKTEVAEVKTEVAEVKTEVAEVKTEVAEVKTEVAEVKTVESRRGALVEGGGSSSSPTAFATVPVPQSPP